MSQQVFAQTTIAVVWDFDKTLIPGYMQAPLFEHYGVDGTEFWAQVNALEATYRAGGVARMTTEIHYLNQILDYIEDGRFAGLDNTLLKNLGAKLEFYPGIPSLFETLNAEVTANPAFSQHEIQVEHYVVSTGLRQMILGSALAEHVVDVWGCELLEEDGRLRKLGYVLDNTSKTRALFEINKGANKHAEIDVNSAMEASERRIPFANMIYLADGPSDVPVFSLLNRNGGHTFGVYRAEDKREYRQIHELQQQGRVQGIGPADYRSGSQTSLWLGTAIEKIGNRIVTERERALGESVGAPPRHLSD
ncbi:MAG: HAD family hydrolase [Pseudomonadota bacterium]